MTSFKILPAAIEDIEGAAEWYERQRAGLGIEFVLEVDQSMEFIQENPKQYPLVYREFHRALVRRFPYSIYFIHRHPEVIVVAVLHQTRSNETKRRRLR